MKSGSMPWAISGAIAHLHSTENKSRKGEQNEEQEQIRLFTSRGKIVKSFALTIIGCGGDRYRQSDQ
jgi:hypothetical protein